MTPEMMEKIDLIAQMLETIAEYLDMEKGGPGSGCSGPNCGRKPSGQITEPNGNKPPIVVPGRGEGNPNSDRIVVGNKPVRLR